MGNNLLRLLAIQARIFYILVLLFSQDLVNCFLKEEMALSKQVKLSAKYFNLESANELK